MKELEKQYNKAVKNPANFDFDRRSYMAGGRAALGWTIDKLRHDTNGFFEILKELENE